jgi:uncharacterized protein involved in high-affinity Fe2+ transport
VKHSQNPDSDFLDSQIKIYDFNDGEEYEANVTELLFGEGEDESGWVPYLTINQDSDENDNKNKAAKISIE